MFTSQCCSNAPFLVRDVYDRAYIRTQHKGKFSFAFGSNCAMFSPGMLHDCNTMFGANDFSELQPDPSLGRISWPIASKILDA
mmetsp:Transcript_41860/g.77498  ORF Transcript_41860/g.77498 Transcript_41860/m.77498 type:complete len:83 (-) Transcript_41860:946-1194(-)